MDEGAVDLQHREMQRLQVRERAQASAEVMEREATAALRQARHQALRVLEVADRRGLGRSNSSQSPGTPLLSICTTSQSRNVGSLSVGPDRLMDRWSKARKHIADDAAVDLGQQLVALRTT
jgi:hypothetical protein